MRQEETFQETTFIYSFLGLKGNKDNLKEKMWEWGHKKNILDNNKQSNRCLYGTKLKMCICCDGWIAPLQLYWLICLTGSISVGVQLVICTSTQNQLKKERGTLCKTCTKMRHFFSFQCLRISIDLFCPLQALNILWDYMHGKQTYPTVCPVHTKHLILMGCQVIQWSFTAVTERIHKIH